MEIKVERIYVTKSYDRSKRYTPVDITSQVIMPIIDVERLDSTLDTSSLVLMNKEKTPIKPFTRIKITITNDDGSIDRIYRLVYTDTPEKLNYTRAEKYKHNIELVEATKWLERFEVDNTTITNYLQWLYHSGEGKIAEEVNPTVVSSQIVSNFAGAVTIPYMDGYLLGANYSGSARFYSCYKLNESATINVRVKPQYRYTRKILFIFAVSQDTLDGEIEEFKIITPSGVEVDAINLTTYAFNELGQYTFRQKYRAHATVDGYDETFARITYEWKASTYADVAVDENPQRYTIKTVIENILGRVGDDSSTVRTGIELPMFQLDSDVAQALEERISPEFTFTQNTLFGVLEQIGNEIHAIPRLVPTPTILVDAETSETTVDDYSNWTTITFDFLGGDTPTADGEFLGYDSVQNGDNYASSFVSNIQNSFQTNNADYISLTEPHSDGFISTRTESADYEVSNDSAVIKTSRPIQRIVRLEVLYSGSAEPLDITEFVKEATDYSLLQDYASTQTDFLGYASKNTAIYYTRGSNVIAGLDYVQDVKFSTDAWSQLKAILNIIWIKSGSGSAPNTALKDLMFRIKYVPFYNIKAKQFKQYIDDYSGDNELFYNQVNAQSVDIESLGENMKGALLRTANEDPTITATFKDMSDIIHAGQLSADGYYAYEVNKEITNKRVKTSTKFSKDWNKLNEFVGIKKNYREWEISERECVETTPCYNQFCIISNELDFDKGNLIPTDEEKNNYIAQLDEYGGFTTLSTSWQSSIFQIFIRMANLFKKEVLTSADYGLASLVPPITGYTCYSFNVEMFGGVSGTISPQEMVVYLNGEKNAIYTIMPISATKSAVSVYVDENSSLYQDLINSRDVVFEYRALKPIEWAMATCKNRVFNIADQQYEEVKNTFLLPASCCSFGNSILVNFGTMDNYAAATYVESKMSNAYALEQNVPYGDQYGRVGTMELKIGTGIAKSGGFDNYNTALVTSKEYYKFDPADLDEANVILDYSAHDFTVNKDSRQKLNFTAQLHFVTDVPDIWIGKAFAQAMPYCGNTECGIIKYAYFTRRPDKFCQTTDTSIWEEIDLPACTYNGDLKYIKYEGATMPADCVGFGLIDNQNRIMLYYNKEIKAGEKSEPIYFQFRRKI